MEGSECKLTWENHSPDFSTRLYKLRNETTYIDATVVCDGIHYNVHKIILSASSDHFHELLVNIEKVHPMSHPVIVLHHDIRKSEFESLLKFIYLGEVGVKEEDLSKVLAVAKMLDIKGLSDKHLEDISEVDNLQNDDTSHENRNQGKSEREPRPKEKKRRSQKLESASKKIKTVTALPDEAKSRLNSKLEMEPAVTNEHLLENDKRSQNCQCIPRASNSDEKTIECTFSKDIDSPCEDGNAVFIKEEVDTIKIEEEDVFKEEEAEEERQKQMEEHLDIAGTNKDYISSCDGSVQDLSIDQGSGTFPGGMAHSLASSPSGLPRTTHGWSGDAVLQFISYYEEKTLLWDAKHPSHFNKKRRNDAWIDTAQKTGKTMEECKKKMTSLLAAMRREKAKMKKSIRTGKGADEVYKSTWYAFKSLHFLWEKEKPGETTSTIHEGRPLRVWNQSRTFPKT